MKLVLLSDPNSAHTAKWATSLADKAIEVHIIGLSENTNKLYSSYNNVKIYNLNINNKDVKQESRLSSKFKYIKTLKKVKKLIKEIKPDIVHSHYATSYGMLGALSKFHPFIISVWGSDVFDFPKKSIIHKQILKYNLKKADKILSTSHVMAKETSLYTNKKIEVTPFGIDLEQFKPMSVNSIFKENDIVIGTIKALETEYGIEYLIKAFKIVFDNEDKLSLKLLIVGGGSQEKKLKKLVSDLDLDDNTIFTGKVPYNEMPKYHNMIDIPVFVSNSESFGVAVIEAGACEKPVIVSNVGGLPEVVEDNITGIIVPPKNEKETAIAIEKLIFDKSLNSKMGKAGRKIVSEKFNWNNNVNQMINIYKNILNK